MINIAYRDALVRFKFKNKLTFKALGERLKTTGPVASDIVHGRREFVTLETARAIFEIVEEVKQSLEV